MSPTPEARALRRRERLILRWQITLICFAFACITFGAAFFYVTRATNRVDDARARSDQQFAAALAVTDNKFRQALHVTTQQFAYTINRSVCTLRPFLKAARTARLAAVKAAPNDAERDLNQKAADAYKPLIAGQITIPVDFNCATLPKNPPDPKEKP